jgi:epoxyqueuosine reductase QueG
MALNSTTPSQVPWVSVKSCHSRHQTEGVKKKRYKETSLRSVRGGIPLKNWLENSIVQFIKSYEARSEIATGWKAPLFAYADPKDPLFEVFKKVVSPTHCLPQDFISDAKTVITYFLPFEEHLVRGNIAGRLSSEAWGRAYIETNQLIAEINAHVAAILTEKGFESTNMPATHNFDESRLMSDWSHRHVAYAAGLGTFGLNNMLITDAGCAGRIGSIVTNLSLEPTQRPGGEQCLFKIDGTCGVCVGACVHNALFYDHFDRYRCYEMCLENAAHLKHIGLADVCGKCIAGMPCAFKGFRQV